MDSFLRNSLVIPRSGDENLFAWEDNTVIARLDGYAVVPIEQYQALLSEKSVPTNPPGPSSSAKV